MEDATFLEAYQKWLPLQHHMQDPDNLGTGAFSSGKPVWAARFLLKASMNATQMKKPRHINVALHDAMRAQTQHAAELAQSQSLSKAELTACIRNAIARKHMDHDAHAKKTALLSKLACFSSYASHRHFLQHIFPEVSHVLYSLHSKHSEGLQAQRRIEVRFAYSFL